MTILPITYLGGIEWFSRLGGGSAGSVLGDCLVDLGSGNGRGETASASSPEVCIDLGENWVKQTSRNRCEILTSGGVAALTVPVHAGLRADGGRIATKDVRVDHSKRWAHVHWQSVVSAYRSAPYFEHYAELFEPVFCTRRHEFLVDLNLQLLAVVLEILKLPMPLISERWVEAAPGDIDLRGKKSLRREVLPTSEHTASPETFLPSPRGGCRYTQVFADRHPFAPGLSIIDLIFNEGPDAHNFLI